MDKEKLLDASKFDPKSFKEDIWAVSENSNYVSVLENVMNIFDYDRQQRILKSERYEKAKKRIDRTIDRLIESSILPAFGSFFDLTVLVSKVAVERIKKNDKLNVKEEVYKIQEQTAILLPFALLKNLSEEDKKAADKLKDKIINFPIEERYVEMAIEVFVSEKNPDAIENESTTNFAGIIKTDVVHFYWLIILCAFAMRYNDTIQDIYGTQIQFSSAAKETAIALSASKGEIKKLNRTIDGMRSDINAANNRAENLQSKVKQLEKENQKLKQETVAIQVRKNKETVKSNYDNIQLEKKYKEMIESLQAENEKLKAENNQFRNDINNGVLMYSEDEFEESDFEDFDSIELPEKDVIFLGGHPGLVNKVSQIYKDWRYVSEKLSDTFSAPTNPQKVIFFAAEHCGHECRDYVLSLVSKDTPIVYVKSTNVNKLIYEMKKGYADVLRKNETAEVNS